MPPWGTAQIGPDAARYLAAADGVPVPRPFHLRVLLPWLLGSDVRAWWVAWVVSWPILIGSMVWWRLAAGDPWQVALAAAALLAGLPGILGPSVVIPVGVDRPATALSLVGVAMLELGSPLQQVGGVAAIALAAGIRETAPAYAAIWAWSLLPLVVLVVPLVLALVRSAGPDPLGPRFQQIADHPIRTSLAAHRGRWRDGWLMVAPWGVCLAALIRPDVQVVVALAVAYGVVLVATDTVRLVQHAAGPVMAVAAAHVVPVEWLLLAVVVHAVWWRTPERI